MHAKTEEHLVDVPIVAGVWGVVVPRVGSTFVCLAPCKANRPARTVLGSVRRSGVHSIASVPSLDLLDDVDFFKWVLKYGSDDFKRNDGEDGRHGDVEKPEGECDSLGRRRRAGRRCSCKTLRKRDMVKKMMLSPHSTNARTRFFVLSHAIFGVGLIEERRNVMKSTAVLVVSRIGF
nr:uncharacterized protein LOC109189836 [Ipomoea batatas]